MKNLKGKKLLVLGGNALSCDIVTTAQRLGIYTIVTDWNDSDKSPAKKIADEAWDISLTDIDALVSKIKEENIDGVTTNYTDSYLIPYARLCKAAGLPALADKFQIESISNKDKSKAVFKNHGIAIPQLLGIDSEKDIERIGDSIEYPVILKPVDQSGQRGIFVCTDKESLKKYYPESLKYSASGKVLVEEYLQGDYVVMFFTIQNGHVTLASMADKPVTDAYASHQVKLPMAYILPSKYVGLCRETVLPKVQAFVDTLKIKQGVIGIEGIVKDNVIKTFEMQFRLGGMRHHEFVAQENGMDLMEMIIRYALTGEFDGWDAAKCDNADFKHTYVLLNVLVNTGKISKIEGLDEIKALPEFTKLTIMSKEGDEIKLAGTVNQIVCKISLKVADKKRLNELIHYIHNTLKVYNESGENMVLNPWEGREL